MMNSIRNLPPSLWHRYRDHLARLSAEDRRLRFGHMLDDRAIDHFVEGLDPASNHVLVCEDEAGVVVGAVLISLLADRSAELAFSVEAAWRGRGLGRVLGDRAVLWLRNRGIRRAQLVCAGENLAMRRLARHLGMTLAFQESSCEGGADLAPPTPWSLLQEAVALHGVLWARYWGTQFRLFMPALRAGSAA